MREAFPFRKKIIICLFRDRSPGGWVTAEVEDPIRGGAPVIKRFALGFIGMEVILLLAFNDDVGADEANNKDDEVEVVVWSLNKFGVSIESKKGFANAAPVAK